MNFWTLYKRELRSIFLSPIAYVVMTGAALIQGAGFAVFLALMIYQNMRGYSILYACLNAFVFWFTIMVEAPLISMRSFSEEYKMGTIEMLLTAPVREWEVVLSKFVSLVTFFVLLWIPVALNVAYVYTFSDQKFDLTWGMVVLPFLMVFLLGVFFISICLFASSLTKNQIIAAILGFALIFAIFCINFLAYLGLSEGARQVVSYLSSLSHMDTFSRGIFDTRPVVLYLSGTAFFLFLTERILEARRLRS
ncbi:MAG: ABC transporter permease subunit [Verrucomicrobium sp.]|nr:ABC transporter permease subunit [Verrucomicrobium sp.]